ncbi:MAG: thiamine phosphate synthase [Minwuia sp.]|uniref:thiamine phosphate synthase n=1 Tax=Minwuia sp. TaxID=2493630 RepID=UPI003A8A182D
MRPESASRPFAARGFALPRVIMPTDLDRVPDPLPSIARLPAGSAVILRDRGHPDRAGWAALLREATLAAGHLFLIANDPDLATAAMADGIHLAEADVGRVPPLGFTTAACHSLEAVRRAEIAGADAVLLSPVFPTASHPGGRVLGLQRARAIAAATVLPVYAMGGVTPAKAQLLGSGFAGFAAIAAFA